jgi:hypothetical protein
MTSHLIMIVRGSSTDYYPLRVLTEATTRACFRSNRATHFADFAFLRTDHFASTECRLRKGAAASKRYSGMIGIAITDRTIASPGKFLLESIRASVLPRVAHMECHAGYE